MPDYNQSIKICVFALICSAFSSIADHFLGETLDLDMTFLQNLFTAIITFLFAIVYYNLFGYRLKGLQIILDLIIAFILFGIVLITGIYQHAAINASIVLSYFLIAMFLICRTEYISNDEDAT